MTETNTTNTHKERNTEKTNKRIHKKERKKHAMLETPREIHQQTQTYKNN